MQYSPMWFSHAWHLFCHSQSVSSAILSMNMGSMCLSFGRRGQKQMIMCPRYISLASLLLTTGGLFLKYIQKVNEFFLSFSNITSVLVFNIHIRQLSIISFSSAAFMSSSLNIIYQSDSLLSFGSRLLSLFFICFASLAFLATESLPLTFSQTGLFLLISVLTLTVLHDPIIFFLYLKKRLWFNFSV